MYPTCFECTFDANVEITSVKDPASLLIHSPQENVWRQSYTTATGQLLSRSRWQGATSTAPATHLEQASFNHDHLGHLTGMTRYLDAAAGASAVTSSWHYDSLGQVLELDEPNSVPQLNTYSRWGELLTVHRQAADASTAIDVVTTYDALGRMTHKEQRHAGVVDPATANDYLYDQGVNAAPQVTPTYMTGRLAQASSPTGAVSFSYDALGQINARVFIDGHGAMYVEQHTTHADGSPATLDLLMPDTGYADEHVTYGFDSAGRGKSVTYANGANHQDLFEAPTIDVFGRVRQAQYGTATYAASYADVGRRLLNNVNVTSSLGSRSITFQGFDPLGRERSRTEVKNATGSGTTSTWAYDALGRLSTALKTTGTTTVSNQQYTYDPLGNLLGIANVAGAPGAINTTLTYLATDRDRICRIRYGTDSGTACNVTYDDVGSITQEPTRTGTRQLSYFPDGSVASITDGGSQAHFRYDAFGEVQELDLTSSTSPDTRTDRRYGGLIGSRIEKPGTTPTTVYTRTIPGPSGFVATLHGPGGPWVFEFGEARGTRFTTDETGAFVQDVDYSPYGEPSSTGAQPGSTRYTNWQWNGGDALAAFGVSHLGARIYDPVIGRFLSRDPLLIPRTSATTNPYAFADNDPVNHSDPSGLVCTQGPQDSPCLEKDGGGWEIYDGWYGWYTGGGIAGSPGLSGDRYGQDTTPTTTPLNSPTNSSSAINTGAALALVGFNQDQIDSMALAAEMAGQAGLQADADRKALSLQSDDYMAGMLVSKIVGGVVRGIKRSLDRINNYAFDASNGMDRNYTPEQQREKAWDFLAFGLSVDGIQRGGLTALPKESEAILSNRVAGKIIGWPTGQGGAARTAEMATSLTAENVAAMQAKGLNRATVESMRAMYQRAISAGEAKLRNEQLLPRARLMDRILELWPK